MGSVLNGKTALVIGGSGGIGREVAFQLVEAGAFVSVLGRHSLPGIESTELDMDNPDNLEILLARVEKTDILCIIRGPFLQKTLHETTPDEWVSIVYANLTLPGMLVSAALPYMSEKKWGRILLFGGTGTDSICGFRTNAAYAAAKTGLSSLVKSVALSYADQGITCNAVCPGFVDTEYISPEEKEILARKNPDGKLISTKEIGEAAVFLLKSSILNGVVLPVDKGWKPAKV